MNHRCLVAVSTVIVVVAVTPLSAAAQSTNTTAPRTPWGAPDLQGVWDFRSITPMERPEELAGQEFLTEEEAANLEQEAVDRNELLLDRPARRTKVTDSVDRGEDGAPGFYNNFWMDEGTTTVATRRTSLVVDPPDGRLPPLTQAAMKRKDNMAMARFGWVEELGALGLQLRCIVGFNSGPPIAPGAYNQNVQVFQTEDHVVLLNEMVHSARVVPLDGRDHIDNSIRQWMGDSRAYWEDDTLVVETTNFLRETSFRSGLSDEHLQLTERFTRVSPTTLMYEVTVNDPTAWTQPWTYQLPMRKSDLPLYEFACHEGNYSLYNILAGARADEQAAAATPASR